MKTKRTICVNLEPELVERIDALAATMQATRTWTIARLLDASLNPGATASRVFGQRAADRAASAPFDPPLPIAIIEIAVEGVPHIAVAATLPEAAALARTRRLRWAAAGRPHELAELMPPLEASASICASIDLAGALATAPNWHRCPPQLIREGLAA
jgi:hypothetical protein